MTYATAEKEATQGRRSRRTLRGIGWTLFGIVLFLEVFTMGGAGFSKLQKPCFTWSS